MSVRTCAAIAALLCVLPPKTASARSCAPQRAASLMIARSTGDVYNQLASDGGELPQSYFVKASIVQPAYAVTLQAHRSVYETQHDGANTSTGVRTIAGSAIAIPWFTAMDATDQARVARCTGTLGIYAGAGLLQTSTNYSFPLGYTHLTGIGIGVERFADPKRRFDLAGTLYYFPAASGAYGGSRLAYTIVTFDVGFRLRLGASQAGFVAGLYQELRSLHPSNRVGQTIVAAPYIGFQFMR